MLSELVGLAILVGFFLALVLLFGIYNNVREMRIDSERYHVAIAKRFFEVADKIAPAPQPPKPERKFPIT